MPKPGRLHEGIIDIFRNCPELLLLLLPKSLGLRGKVKIDTPSFAALSPASYQPDLVIVFDDGERKIYVIIELQLRIDDAKRFSWPLHTAVVHGLRKCLTVLVVVTPYDVVAKWASTPIPTFQSNSPFVPLVLGPEALPQTLTEAMATTNPELSLLCALMHNDNLELVTLALKVVTGLDEVRAAHYTDILFSGLDPTTRQALEELMQSGKVTYNSEFAQRYVRFGEAKGREEGREEGLEKGREEALLIVLEARGFVLTADQAARVASATQLELKGWLRRAVSVETVDQLFAG